MDEELKRLNENIEKVLEQRGSIVRRFDSKTHEEHHEFIAAAINVLGKLDNIKWGVIKAIIIFIALSCLGVFGKALFFK